MIKAVVFDLDHTLFDRHGTLKAVAKNFYKEFQMNLRMSEEEVVEKWIYADDNFVYIGWQFIYDYLVENNVFAVPPGFDNYRSFVYKYFRENAVEFPDTLPMLNSLKEKGYKVALITNGHHDLQYRKLDLLGLRYVFDEIIVSGDVSVEKPDKEIFLIMAEKLGVKPSEMIYVGDHPVNDIKGAKSAGCKTIWMKCKSPNIVLVSDPDETVLCVEDVIDAVEKIANR